MAVWNDLPAELRLAIYEYLAYQDDDLSKTQYQHLPRTNHSLSTYAAVSREFQAFFEERTFKQLILRQSDLAEFEKILVPHRRRWLRRLWLRIELRRYSCRSCFYPECARDANENSATFTTSIWKLFKILKGWEIKGQIPLSQISLTLLLSAYSPSDIEQHFRDFYINEDLSTFHSTSHLYNHYGPQYCWCYGLHVVPSWGPRLRLFGLPLELDLSQVSAKVPPLLPTLDFVTGFIMSRQFYRKIPSLGLILRSFPNLQDISYEQWRRVEGNRDGEYAILREVIEALPSNLRRFSIFLDANVGLHWPNISKGIMESDVASAHKLRTVSRQYTKIDASFFVDAQYFFATFISGPSGEECWPNLETFTMTSALLSSKSRGRYGDMLEGAAKAALRMPKLRMLQIWFGYANEFCLFRYMKEQEDSLIEWVRTSNALRGPNQGVVQAWQAVADETRRGQLRIKQPDIKIPKLKNYISAHPFCYGPGRIIL
ncbi:hypothetical protein F4781DRAFT_200186 [Annulohypoxylon bovei var. microspora]|nr:hypothetical protein F4781DRAFT_200186 [Annulohypoxylon bovei var. microspora]